jgi:hypothetical protein
MKTVQKERTQILGTEVSCSKTGFSFFLSFFFLSPTSVYITRLGVEGYYSFDLTEWHKTGGKTPLDEGSARRRNLYLTTHNTHNRQTSIFPAGFEPAIPAGERLQTPLGYWQGRILEVLKQERTRVPEFFDMRAFLTSDIWGSQSGFAANVSLLWYNAV